MNIYYIHGFASCSYANSDKENELKQIFPDSKIIMLDYDSAASYDFNLSNLIKNIKKTILPGSIIIGTSLGGFFALILASVYSHLDLQCIVFNPAIDPHSILNKFIGVNKNNYTGDEFLLTDSVVNSYKGICVDGNVSNTVSVVAIDDDVIDPISTAKKMISMSRVIIVEGGHRISSLLEFKDILVYAQYKAKYLHA